MRRIPFAQLLLFILLVINKTEDLSVKQPKFELVVEQQQQDKLEHQFLLLTMSSAMEAIKAVHRDLFLWGKGNGLKVKVNFVNEKEFNVEELKKLNEKAQANDNSDAVEHFDRVLNDLGKKIGNVRKGQY